MGFVGAVLILRWSWSLLRQTGLRLLDYQAPEEIHDAVRQAIESDGQTEIFDLHVWLIAPGFMRRLSGSSPTTRGNRIITKAFCPLHLASGI